MRGCLFTLLLGVVALALLVTFGLPSVAAGALTGAVTAAGLQADDTTVTVTSDPPTDLLGLHADRVHITASDATFRDLQIGSLDITLTGVSLVGRTADGVDGQLRDVTVRSAGPETIELATIRLSGGGDAVTATTTVPAGEAETLVADAVAGALGARPTSVALTAPDHVQVRISGVTVNGRLSVNDSGDLVARVLDGPSAGQVVVLLGAGQDIPIELTTATITRAGALRLSGRLTFGLLG